VSDRLKILDCNRKAILGLPSAALHLWLCYYMNEDEENESYLSLDEVETQIDSRMGRRSIIKWTQWLVRKGWLVDTEKTAAQKYIQRGRPATAGAYQIKTYRADDPTNAKVAQGETDVSQQTVSSAKSAPVQPAHKVYGSSSGSCSPSCSPSGSRSGYKSDSDYPAGKALDETEVQTGNRETGSQNLKPTPHGRKGKRRTGKDGTPYPQDFDTWDVAEKLAWSEEHNGTGRNGTGSGTNGSGSDGSVSNCLTAKHLQLFGDPDDWSTMPENNYGSPDDL
jgi:hypothetical protein